MENKKNDKAVYQAGKSYDFWDSREDAIYDEIYSEETIQCTIECEQGSKRPNDKIRNAMIKHTIQKNYEALKRLSET